MAAVPGARSKFGQMLVDGIGAVVLLGVGGEGGSGARRWTPAPARLGGALTTSPEHDDVPVKLEGR